MGVEISSTFNEKIGNYKVAFFDIDGTIFKSNYSLSPGIISIINKLQDRGIITCLATGRPYFGSLKVIKELGIQDPSMFSSGGLVVDPESGKVLFTESINDSNLPGLLNDLRNIGVHIELYAHDKYFIEETNDISAMHLKYLDLNPLVSPFTEVLAEFDINKIVAISLNPTQLLALESITAKYPSYSYAFSYGASHPEITFLNITSSKASRKKAFDFLTTYLNVLPEETIAFGDSDADITFLRHAGLGIAVGNATRKAKEAARYITGSVEEDGVVYALKAMGV